jgi:hypothetical protein
MCHRCRGSDACRYGLKWAILGHTHDQWLHIPFSAVSLIVRDAMRWGWLDREEDFQAVILSDKETRSGCVRGIGFATLKLP